MLDTNLAKILRAAEHYGKQHNIPHITIRTVLYQILLLPKAELLCKKASLDYHLLQSEIVQHEKRRNTVASNQTVKTRSNLSLKRSEGLQRLLINTFCLARQRKARKASLEDFLKAFGESCSLYSTTDNAPCRAMKEKKKTDSTEETGALTTLRELTTHFTDILSNEYFYGSFECEDEIAQILQILSRKKSNNVLLIGEAGVGKTSLVKTVYQRIMQGRVPAQCAQLQFYLLNIALLVSGTRYRGDFEKKFNTLIKELTSIENAVLVLENMHTIVGAGSSSENHIDFVSMLKPVLNEGIIRCIGCTTHSEYSQYMESDKSFLRQFKTIYLQEPTVEKTKKIITSIVPTYEKFHGITYTKQAIQAAIDISHKYFSSTPIVDTTLSILDDAGVFVRNKAKRHFSVHAKDVHHVVSNIVHLPNLNIKYKKHELLLLQQKLNTAIIGQHEATHIVGNTLLRYYMGFHSQDKPIASFLFYGPTGVGKTELSKQIAAILQLPFHRFDMSEYSEMFSITKFIGSTLSHNETYSEGLLIQTIRKTPRCVILLDEIEKAHMDIIHLLLQIMDYGVITSSSGIKANFRNAIIIMTSNAGAAELYNASIGFERIQAPTIHENKKNFEKYFTPEFRNRIDAIIPFTTLSSTDLLTIVQKKLYNTSLLLKQYNLRIQHSQEALHYIAKHGSDPLYGVRPLQRYIEKQIYDPIIEGLLLGKFTKGDTLCINLNKNVLSIEKQNDTL